MPDYEVVVSEIDFDFSTNISEICFEDQSNIVSEIIDRTWILAVDADENLTGPLCQKISNATGCLVRDVSFTAKLVE